MADAAGSTGPDDVHDLPVLSEVHLDTPVSGATAIMTPGHDRGSGGLGLRLAGRVGRILSA